MSKNPAGAGGRRLLPRGGAGAGAPPGTRVVEGTRPVRSSGPCGSAGLGVGLGNAQAARGGPPGPRDGGSMDRSSGPRRRRGGPAGALPGQSVGGSPSRRRITASRRPTRSSRLTWGVVAPSYAARVSGSASVSASASSRCCSSGVSSAQYPDDPGLAPPAPGPSTCRACSSCSCSRPRGRLRLGPLRPALETGRRREVLPDRLGEVGADVLDPLRLRLPEPVHHLDLVPDALLGELPHQLGGHGPRHAAGHQLRGQTRRFRLDRGRRGLGQQQWLGRGRRRLDRSTTGPPRVVNARCSAWAFGPGR